MRKEKALRLLRFLLYSAIAVLLVGYLIVLYERKQNEEAKAEAYRRMKIVLEEARQKRSRERSKKLGAIELEEDWKADDLGDFPGTIDPYRE